jgi:hypothetical protein
MESIPTLNSKDGRGRPAEENSALFKHRTSLLGIILS